MLGQLDFKLAKAYASWWPSKITNSIQRRAMLAAAALKLGITMLAQVFKQVFKLECEIAPLLQSQ